MRRKFADQEHDRLPAVRVPRRRHAARDLPPAGGRAPRARWRSSPRRSSRRGPSRAHTTVAWLHFPLIEAAVEPVPELVAAGARAVELMVAPALIVGRAQHARARPSTGRSCRPSRPRCWSSSAAPTTRSSTPGEADAGAGPRAATSCCARRSSRATHEAIELAWSVREGLFGLVGRMRPLGTALIVEDVCVRPGANRRVRARPAGAAGRARLPARRRRPRVGRQPALPAHARLLQARGPASATTRSWSGLVELIVDKYDGSLKAEHGTGVNMAPYVEREWGAKATEMMWRVKAARRPARRAEPRRGAQPRPRRAPAQPQDASRRSRRWPRTASSAGSASRSARAATSTTTPRQRIVLRREMARQPEGSPVYEALLRDFEHDAIQTCAADGTCMTSCPVAIDTGKLIKEFRAPRAHRARGARRAGGRAALRGGRARRARRAARRPRRGGRRRRPRGGRGARAVRRRVTQRARAGLAGERCRRPRPRTLPATRARRRGRRLPAGVHQPDLRQPARRAGRSPTLPEALVEVSRRAGRPLWIPADVAGHCCATPWSSKGYRAGQRLHGAAHRRRAVALERRGAPAGRDRRELLRPRADPGRGRQLDEERRERFDRIEVLDSIAWAHDHLLPRLDVRAPGRLGGRAPDVLRRPPGPRDQARGGRRARWPTRWSCPPAPPAAGWPATAGCCTPSCRPRRCATSPASSRARELDACLCANRTCEIALHEVTGRPYASFVLLLEELTRPRP